MEGLALKYFDNRHKVISIYIGNYEWLVIQRSFFESSTSKQNNQLDDNEGIDVVFGSKNTHSRLTV